MGALQAPSDRGRDGVEMIDNAKMLVYIDNCSSQASRNKVTRKLQAIHADIDVRAQRQVESGFDWRPRSRFLRGVAPRPVRKHRDAG